jgi:hypothetical protein
MSRSYFFGIKFGPVNLKNYCETNRIWICRRKTVPPSQSVTFLAIVKGECVQLVGYILIHFMTWGIWFLPSGAGEDLYFLWCFAVSDCCYRRFGTSCCNFRDWIFQEYLDGRGKNFHRNVVGFLSEEKGQRPKNLILQQSFRQQFSPKHRWFCIRWEGATSKEL